jgi:hypothetical protein
MMRLKKESEAYIVWKGTVQQYRQSDFEAVCRSFRRPHTDISQSLQVDSQETQ